MTEIIKLILNIIKSIFSIKETRAPSDIKKEEDKVIQDKLDRIKELRSKNDSGSQLLADQLINEMEAERIRKQK